MTVTTDVKRAVAALASGHLCAIPTETVYGLAANALDESAVARVFQAKSRPIDHPLIVHVANLEQVSKWITHLPDWAQTLAAQLWPGPLTLVGYRTKLATDAITGGQETVAVRIPSHPIAQQVLSELAADGVLGLVAPSANRFGHVSPTSANHVAIDLGEYLAANGDLILDGGICEVGLESTIVLATNEQPVILRLGAITAQDIQRITGVAVSQTDRNLPRVSGALDSHYAPRAKVILLTETSQVFAENSGFLALSQIATPDGLHRLAAPNSVTDFAHDLYTALRAGDDLNLETIYVVPPLGAGLAQAITDRLERAAF
ncbi:MAG: L-threonylcarbamoyladenylate synthase [Candidatus Nanopelagicales bacterium]|nr:L-threonylcarbamoyladenylate synthase [Candidatus Nanopelagicales bacterium]